MPRTAALPRRAAVLVLAAALGTLTACGGSDDDGAAAAGSSSSSSAPSSTAEDSGSAASSSAPAEDQAGKLTVTGVDFAFQMDTTDLSAGDYQVDFVNDGGASHDVVIEKDGAEVARSEVIPPGETSTFDATLEPGEYVFYCSVGNHRAMGMEVTVTVT